MKSLKKKKEHNVNVAVAQTNGNLRGDSPFGIPHQQRPLSGKDNSVPTITANVLGYGPDLKKVNGFMNHHPPPGWATNSSSEKEGSYQPFKSVTGRSTPLEDPYQLEIAPQDPGRIYRPPSRAASLCSAYRKSEGSVVYQPLTPTNHATAWSNSLMFNKQPSEVYVDFLPQPPMPPPPHTMPPVPMINTIRIMPDNLYQITTEELTYKKSSLSLENEPNRRSSMSSGKQPGGLAYTPINGYITTGAPPEAYQFQKPQSHKPHKVTVVPDGKVFGEPSISSSHLDDKFSSVTSDGYSLFNFRKFLKVSALHIPLGLCLFALGLARLLLYSISGLGLELVYGIYVVIAGILGVYGSQRYNYCSVIACCIMSMLSCILCIPPFISGKFTALLILQ